MNIPIDISMTVLETKRLILRPWKESDIDDFYEYASVDGVGQMAGWNPHRSKEESMEILNLFIEEKKTFAIELKRNHKVIGSVGLDEIYCDLGEPYTSLNGREIGYVLSKDYWGCGIMPEAVSRIIQYCFQNIKCDYLQCSHAVENLQSKRVIEKLQFTFIKEYERKNLNGTVHRSWVYVLMR